MERYSLSKTRVLLLETMYVHNDDRQPAVAEWREFYKK